MGEPVIQATEQFETFYKDHYRTVLAVVLGLTKRAADAEDITQDAFLKAQRRWDEVSGYQYPVAWVKRVAVNLAMSRFRRLAAETRALLRVGSDQDTVEPAESADELWAAVRALPRLQAQCVALFYIDDLSVVQISEVLDVAQGTVKSSLSRARAALARTLGEEVAS